MYALAPYAVKVSDTEMSGPKSDRFHELGSVRGFDLATEIEKILAPTISALTQDASKKRVHEVKDVVFDKMARIVDGVIDYGDYGNRSRIIDLKQ